MLWTKPVCDEIKMDAEIGSYQADDADRDPLFVECESSDE
jgi:hypothetical protein